MDSSLTAFQGMGFPPALGNHVALDFTNTIEYRNTPQETEFLGSYLHVLGWLWQAGLLADAQAAELLRQAQAQPTNAARALKQILALREGLYRLCSARIEGKPLPADDLDTLNGELLRLLSLRRLGPGGELLGWHWHYPSLDSAWGPLLLAAAELLTSEQMALLRQCPGCGWLFIDLSRNRRRRWCSMEFCGSKAKSRRQYQRKKQGEG